MVIQSKMSIKLHFVGIWASRVKWEIKMPVLVNASELKVESFLGCQTPQAWVDAALQNQVILLIDHAHCEKKAASTALSLIYRYVDKPDLLQKMSRLAREELRHFEKVLEIM